MTTLPRKWAPSAIATRGATRSPSTDPVSRSSTFSLAVMVPVTAPSTIATFTKISGSLLVKAYAPVETDPQAPHTRDEIYVVIP